MQFNGMRYRPHVAIPLRSFGLERNGKVVETGYLDDRCTELTKKFKAGDTVLLNPMVVRTLSAKILKRQP